MICHPQRAARLYILSRSFAVTAAVVAVAANVAVANHHGSSIGSNVRTLESAAPGRRPDPNGSSVSRSPVMDAMAARPTDRATPTLPSTWGCPMPKQSLGPASPCMTQTTTTKPTQLLLLLKIHALDSLPHLRIGSSRTKNSSG